MNAGAGSNQAVFVGGGGTVDGGNGVQLTVNGAPASVNLGSGANVNYYADGGSVTTGGASNVTVWNDGVQIINLGSGCIDGYHCDGDSVSGTGETISVDGNSQVSVDGSSNDIMAQSGSDLSIDDDGNTVYGSGVDVSLSEDVSANIVGNGNDVTTGGDDLVGAYGGGDSLTTQAGDHVYLSGTDGDFDSVTATADNASGTAVDGSLGGIYLDNNAQANVFGGNDAVTLGGTGDSLGVYGGANDVSTGAGNLVVLSDTGAAFDAITANNDVTGGVTANGQGTGIFLNADTAANLYGSDDATTLAGAGDVLGAYGGGNTITTGADDLLVAGDTGGNFDAIDANGDQSGGTVVSGQGTGIILDADTAANLYGSNNSTTLGGAADVLGAYGGGNTITTGADDLLVAGDTGGNFDVIDATGDQTGGTVVSGQGTGIILDADTAANLFGSDNSTTLGGAADVLGAYGGGNTITTGADDLLVAGDTGGDYDQIDANGDQTGGTVVSGQGTGIILNGNAQASVNGSGDSIELSSDDALGVTGGGNTINGSADDQIGIGGTNGNYDQINVSGDQLGSGVSYGVGSGVYLNPDAQAQVSGSNNGIALGNDDIIGAVGGGNTINGTADDQIGIGSTNGDVDAINVSGDQLGSAVDYGVGSGIYLNPDTQANVAGSYDGIALGTGDTLGAAGGSNTINSGAATLVYVTQTGGAVDTLNVSNDQADGNGAGGAPTGVILAANAEANLLGSNDSVTVGAAGDVLGAYGNSNDVSAYGSTVALYGTGDTGTIDNGSLYLGAGSQVSVNANSDEVSSTGANVALYGNSNDINTYSGAITLYGSGDTGTIDGNNLYVGAGSQVSVNANSDEVSSTGANVALYGNSNDIDTYSGAVTLYGSGDTGTIDGNNLYVGSGSQVSVNANSDEVSSTGANVALYGNSNDIDTYSGAVTLYGSDDYGTVDESSLYLGGGSEGNFTANSDQVSSTGANVDLNGDNDTVTTYGGSVTINGTGDYGTIDSSNLYLTGGSQGNFTANYDQITTAPGANLQATGNGNAENQGFDSAISTTTNGHTDSHYVGDASTPYTTYDDITGSSIDTERVTNFIDGSHAVEIWDSQGNQAWDKTDALFDKNGTLQLVKTDFNNGSWESTAFDDPASATYSGSGELITGFASSSIVFNRFGTELGVNFYNSDNALFAQIGGSASGALNSFFGQQATVTGNGEQTLSAFNNDASGSAGIFGNVSSQIGGDYGNSSLGVADRAGQGSGEVQSNASGGLEGSAGNVLGYGSSFSSLEYDPNSNSNSVIPVVELGDVTFQ